MGRAGGGAKPRATARCHHMRRSTVPPRIHVPFVVPSGIPSGPDTGCGPPAPVPAANSGRSELNTDAGNAQVSDECGWVGTLTSRWAGLQERFRARETDGRNTGQGSRHRPVAP
ncbi:hypothetical protein GCM10010415_45770 [Streptomyces atrovirens]